MAKTLAWRTDGRLCVSVHTAENPTPMEWSGFVKMAIEMSERGPVRVFVVSYGGGPDGAQRSELTKALAGNPSPTVLLTTSRLVRALLSAFSWFNPNMHVVGLWDDEAAGDHLDLTSDERRRAAVLRQELEVELGITAQRPSAPA